eukprot:TRINITY_DN1034_c0_g1_i3.p1 TRINITY_DN1034_c0_g1~~TRINITY_DN1034_c0_g1_i3.p1  ORF type:complete len:386 (-),score=110.43 TRINITY_DN1034_c0_g1_i3:66-1223(-)
MTQTILPSVSASNLTAKPSTTATASSAATESNASLVPPSATTTGASAAQPANTAKIAPHKHVRASAGDQRGAMDAFLSGAATYKRPVSTSNTTDDYADHQPLAKRGRLSADVQLTSIRTLMDEVEKHEHEGLRELLKAHVWVGCVDNVFSVAQFRTKLYLINHVALNRELVYQQVLQRFKHFGCIKLSEPADVHEMLMLALDSEESGWTEEDGDKDAIARFVENLLQTHSEMLLEYFCLDFHDIDGALKLCTLPLIIGQLLPQSVLIPMFLLRLGTEIEWDREQECFHTFASELAEFYAPVVDLLETDTAADNSVGPAEDPVVGDAAAVSADNAIAPRRSAAWMSQHVLFPAFRSLLVPTQKLADDGAVLEIASLDNLYKVFERC